jgi:hypothetical protein
MSFVLEKKSVEKVNIYGKEYSLSKPTVRQTEKLQEEIKLSKDDQSASFGLMKKWVEGLGLPGEVIMDMELDHFVSLVEHLSGSKKN